MDGFQTAFVVTVGEEGGYTSNPADPGNWTGGAIGHGVCAGTNWGISAAAYPTLAIRALTRDAAETIYRRDFWDKVRGSDLPPPLGGLVFDAAVNNGAERARLWLQAALTVATDGDLGPETMAALSQLSATPGGVVSLCCEFQSRRLDFMACLPTWRQFGLGWSRRLCGVLAQALVPVAAAPPSALAAEAG